MVGPEEAGAAGVGEGDRQRGQAARDEGGVEVGQDGVGARPLAEAELHRKLPWHDGADPQLGLGRLQGIGLVRAPIHI